MNPSDKNPMNPANNNSGYQGFEGYGSHSTPEGAASGSAGEEMSQHTHSLSEPESAAAGAAGGARSRAKSRDSEFASSAPLAAEPAGEAAAAKGKGGSGASVPLRGIAMILLAVAAVLIAFGVYHLMKKDNSTDTAATASSTQQTAVAPQSGTAGRSAVPSAQPASPAPSAPASAAPAAPQSTAQAAPNAAAGAVNVDKNKIQVTVLNNSNVTGLAEKVSGNLSADKWKTNYGNLPTYGDSFQQSVVLYDANNAEAKAAAEQVAQKLGITAQPKTDQLNGEISNAKMFTQGQPGQVVVVATESLK